MNYFFTDGPAIKGIIGASIDWRDPLPRFGRVRVLRHTCEELLSGEAE